MAIMMTGKIFFIFIFYNADDEDGDYNAHDDEAMLTMMIMCDGSHEDVDDVSRALERRRREMVRRSTRRRPPVLTARTLSRPRAAAAAKSQVTESPKRARLRREWKQQRTTVNRA